MSAKLDYHWNILIRKLGPTLPFSSWGTFLGRSIGYVVFLRTREQVIGANTGSNIAMMTDIHAFRNRAIMQFMAKAMGKLGTGLSTYPDLAVAGRHLAPSPQPTSRAQNRMNGAVLIDFCPKARDRVGDSSLIHSVPMVIDVLHGIAFNSTDFGVRVRSNWGKSAASTTAMRIRNFCAWIAGRCCKEWELESIMEGHQKLTFLVSNPGTPREGVAR